MGIGVFNHTITLLGRLFDTRQPVQPVYPDTADKPLCVCTPIRQPFPRCSPEEIGIPSQTIRAFLSSIADDDSLNMHSILIFRNGKMIAEASFGDQDPRMWKSTFSACKSIVSLAIGFLYDEGKIHPDDKLGRFFPGRIPQLSRAREITVRQLLTMSSGAIFNEGAMLVERDWIKGFVSGNFNPGKFSYNSLNTYMLSALVKECSGESLTDYLRPRLFDPLSIDQVFWEKCPMGIEKGGWGMYIRPEDLAKIGQLVYQNGIWNGRRLLSEEWIAMATQKQIETGNVSPYFDYGFQIWTGREHDSFLFNGMLGQNVLCMRENGVMLVSFAGNDEFFHSSNYFRYAETYFGKPFSPSLPPNRQAYEQLQKTIAALTDAGTETTVPTQSAKTIFRFFHRKNVAAQTSTLPAECALLNGKRFTAEDDSGISVGIFPVSLQVVQNNYVSGFTQLSFRLEQDRFFMDYMEDSVTHTLCIGFEKADDGVLTIGTVPYHIKTLGEFTQDEDRHPLLKLRITFQETPFTRYIKLYYAGSRPHMKYSERPGGEFIFSKVVDIKSDLENAPIIGGPLNKVDNDYLRYRIDKKFSPDIRLRLSEPHVLQTKEDQPHG